MHYRPLGNTGIQVSTISMGCNRLGEDDEDPHWDGLVGRAIELGFGNTGPVTHLQNLR